MSFHRRSSRHINGSSPGQNPPQLRKHCYYPEFHLSVLLDDTGKMTRTVSTNTEGVPTYWGTSGRPLQMLITAVATTDFLLFGYDQGVMSGIIESDAFLEDFPEAGWGSTWQGFIVSIYAVGCLFGAIFILTLGDKLGRRKSIFIGASVMIIGVIIQVCCVGVGSGSTAQFIIGRFITGVSSYQDACQRMSLIGQSARKRYQHIDNPYLPSRVLQGLQQRQGHLYRGWQRRRRHAYRLLDRLWLHLRSSRPRLAFPYRLPDLLRSRRSDHHDKIA
jgi:hypothetical protein